MLAVVETQMRLFYVQRKEVSEMYWITGILGLALIVAPFVLNYSSVPIAMWSSIILGAAIVVVSAIKAFVRDAAKWEYWVAGILGLLAIIAPFVLGFRAQVRPLDASIILGVIVLLFAGYQALFAPSQQA
jgi:bacteriorhodopsin